MEEKTDATQKQLFTSQLKHANTHLILPAGTVAFGRFETSSSCFFFDFLFLLIVATLPISNMVIGTGGCRWGGGDNKKSNSAAAHAEIVHSRE